ncbi:CDP-alcohol phosphatidyltransferase family protein, partial [Myxococcota bacterium]|nr:CDP-alcohol phosphatidyltransferase family protein [Myxococcota bacterium]
TLLSTLCCAVSFLLAALANDSTFAMLAAAVLVFAYVSLDNMDGAHARRTQQSSRLGEFLDHWLDTLNNGFVVLGACLAVGLGPLLTLLVFSAATLAFFGVQLELRYTGVFRMGRIADIEGNTAVSGLYILVALFGSGLFFGEVFSGGPTVATLIGLGVMGQALMTLATAAWRLRDHISDFFPILLCLAILIAWSIQGSFSSAGILVIAFFVNPVFTSRPILFRLLGRSTLTADWVAIAAVALGGLASAYIGGIAAGWAVVLVMVGLTLSHALATVSALTSEP